MTENILKETEAVKGDRKNFRVGQNLERGGKAIGNSKIVDLDDEEEIGELYMDNEEVIRPDQEYTKADKHQ